MRKNQKNDDSPLNGEPDGDQAPSSSEKNLQSDSEFILSQKKPWNHNSNPIWLASTVSLMRNVEKFKFPGKLPPERKKQLITLMGKGIIEGDSGLKNPKVIKGEDIGHLEKEFLVEQFLSTSNFNQAQQGEGFILDETGDFLASMNLRDHIQLSLIDCNGELENTWSKLVKIETALGKAVSFCFSPKFGFLTSDPTQCGTALIVSLFLQVSGLIHTGQIDPILEKLADDSLIISGIQGSPTEIIGDILVIQNSFTLGVTEENIISGMRGFITKMLVEEGRARAEFKKKNDGEYKDKVSRAYGVLIHSYQIETIEALNALSLLKLGSECGWVTGIDNLEINELFFNCRRAHLLRNFRNDKISQEEIPHRRAEYIHKSLKDVKLAI